MSGDTTEEKNLPPSPKKLREARRKGQIAHSKDMVSAVVTTTAFCYLLIRCVSLFAKLRDSLQAVPDLLDRPFAESVSILWGQIGADVGLAVAPFVALLAIAAIVTNIVVNGGVLVAVDPILPKFERLDPVAGFKRIFALKTSIELIKSIVKLAALAILTYVILIHSLQALVEIPVCGLQCAPTIVGRLVQPLILTSVGVFLMVGGIDIGIQRWLFRRDMRMTRTEQKRERKEQFGDPMIRSRRRQELRSDTKTGLRNATFVICSADVALALRYAKPDALVPILVARGADDGARQLLDQARALNLPVVFDAAATVLVAQRVKLGRSIVPDTFEPVIACMYQADITLFSG
jgi:type III secretion protein U